MNSNSRIASIIQATPLPAAVTGFASFDLGKLDNPPTHDFEVPTNLRLGQMVERIMGELIRTSTNYKLRYENVQLVVDKTTIGELDFIVEAVSSQQIIHIELAYKFYLLDPSISPNPTENWIGPNRRDSLVEKLAKLKTKQFPLLQHTSAKEVLRSINTENATQALCMLASLYIPKGYKGQLPGFEQTIKGIYMDFAAFKAAHTATKQYYIPSKKEWGMSPSDQSTWLHFEEIEKILLASLGEKQAPLVWQKDGNQFEQLFVVWW